MLSLMANVRPFKGSSSEAVLEPSARVQRLLLRHQRNPDSVVAAFANPAKGFLDLVSEVAHSPMMIANVCPGKTICPSATPNRVNRASHGRRDGHLHLHCLKNHKRVAFDDLLPEVAAKTFQTFAAT